MLKEFCARQVAVEQVLLDRAETAVEAFPNAEIAESEDLFGDNGEDEEDGEEEEDQEE